MPIATESPLWDVTYFCRLLGDRASCLIWVSEVLLLCQPHDKDCFLESLTALLEHAVLVSAPGQAPL